MHLSTPRTSKPEVARGANMSPPGCLVAHVVFPAQTVQGTAPESRAACSSVRASLRTSTCSQRPNFKSDIEGIRVTCLAQHVLSDGLHLVLTPQFARTCPRRHQATGNRFQSCKLRFKLSPMHVRRRLRSSDCAALRDLHTAALHSLRSAAQASIGLKERVRERERDTERGV